MRKSSPYFMVIFLAIAISGCAYTANIKDTVDIYRAPAIQGAPKIILADLNDNRADKNAVGRVGALDLKSNTAINIVLTNRIASRLRDEGFNVQKSNLTKPMDKNEMIEALKNDNGNAFLSGGLDNFFIASFDAIMEKGKGKATFYIKIFDKDGNSIFNKSYSGYAENWIGATGQFGCEKLIEQCIQDSVDEVFKDEEFRGALAKIKK